MLIATFSLPHNAVALEHAFQELPELEVEAERIAAHSRAWVMPCLWAANAEFNTGDEVLSADPTVNEIVDGYEFGDDNRGQQGRQQNQSNQQQGRSRGGRHSARSQQRDQHGQFQGHPGQQGQQRGGQQQHGGRQQQGGRQQSQQQGQFTGKD